MLLFHGGFTKEQANKIEKHKYKLYPKLSVDEVKLTDGINTFWECDINKSYKSFNDIKNYIRKDMYKNQYIYFFKYLYNALDFCCFDHRYLLVADVREEIVEPYIGVGRYFKNYRIEYRVPGSIIIPEHVVEVIQCDSSEIKEQLIKKYADVFRNDNEAQQAEEIMKQKKLSFVDHRLLYKAGD